MAMSDEKAAGSAYYGTSRKPRNIKLHNQRLVLSLLREAPAISASEIAQKINLSITTVMKILLSLQNSHVVKSMGKGASTEEGGKKPELFSLDETYKYAIGCYIVADRVEMALVDFRCNVLDNRRSRFPAQTKIKTVLGEAAELI